MAEARGPSRSSLDGMRLEISGVRAEMTNLRTEMDNLRKEVRAGFIRQHAILANNSVLIDEQAERIDGLEKKIPTTPSS